MAETAITAALSKFGELATREVALLLQVGDDIMLLRDQLEWLQAIIRDADRKRRAGTDGLTRVWLRQTRDVALAAEDAIDDFFHKVDPKIQHDQSWKTWHRYIAGWMSQITMRHQLSGRITRIRRRLDQISQSQKEHNIEHTPSRIWTSSATALTAPWDDSLGVLVGIEEEKELLRCLLEDGGHDQKMYISVLGESGSGKDTLVGSVYAEMSSPEKKFDVMVWFSMPPDSSTDSSTRDVLKQILWRVVGQVEQSLDQVQSNCIIDVLRQLLGTKKYLVVLSGMSSKAMLNCIGASLPDGKNGSRVVLILERDAQGEEVARHAKKLNRNIRNNILRLGRWDKKRSWDLFHSRVLGDQAQLEDLNRSWGEEDKERSEYEDNVHAITGGHPLTLVVLAGLLRHKEKPDEWKALIEHLMNPVAATEGEKPELEEVAKRHPQLAVVVLAPPAAAASASQPKSMRMAMQMVFSESYDDLPQDLKSCLVYFAAYPKNINISAESIVRMWTAEGFIKPRKGKTLEELGHMHLRELISRYLVQKRDCGGTEYVSVHSCLQEFLLSEARQARFMEVHDNDDVFGESPASVRRLSTQNNGNGYTPFTKKNKLPKLRSFICRVDEEEEEEDKLHRSDDAAAREGHDDDASSMLSCVCVIPRPCPAKEGHGDDINFLRRSKLLRLISLQGLSLHKLPRWIGEMIHLRYLRVDCPCLKELPSSINRLLNLQTLDIRYTRIEKIDPKFWTIKALRHVLATRLKLPVSLVKKLGELQTLHGVCTPDEKWDEGNCPLDKMTKLRSLEMHGFTASKHEGALQSALKNMHLLEHLKLQGDKMPCRWLLTEPSLLYLHSMVLDGDIMETLEAGDVGKVRPNLTLVKLRKHSDELKKISDELKEMGINIKGIDE